MNSTSETVGPRSVSLLGCGWLGIALAPALMQSDFHVRGSTTRSSRLSVLSSLGIEPLLLRVEPELEAELEPVDTPEANSSRFASAGRFFESSVLVIGLPPETALGADYHLGQLRSILSRVAQSSRPSTHIVYLSSTSIYGAHQGAVDETTTLAPDSETGQILVRAEHLLSQFAAAHALRLTIVRPGGLIGPGRHPGLFLSGRKNAINGEAPVNLIAQLDLVEILVTLIGRPSGEPVETAIYNAVSSHHPSRREFYVRAAEAIGVEPPTFQTAPVGLTPDTPKLVSSAKVRSLEGVHLRFDDLYAAMGIKVATELSS